MKEVNPKVYYIGSTSLKVNGPGGLREYLIDTGNEEFLNELTNIDEMDICSFYGKLCYKSLTLGKNENISKIRDIKSNFINLLEVGHFSCIEHAQVNFVFENVSRVFHTEQVRHRHCNFSCESGRYVAEPEYRVWIPKYLINRGLEYVNEYIKIMVRNEHDYLNFRKMLTEGLKTFHEKKMATSCARRVKPLGAGETMGVSMNLRSLRHIIEMRTSQFAEEEIRLVYNQVADIMEKEIPLLFHGMEKKLIDGFYEYKTKR